MSFRARIALVAAGAVAVAVAVLSVATYLIARDVLDGQVDRGSRSARTRPCCATRRPGS